MDFAFGAARWVVGKALAPVTDGMLEAWAASAGLGPNIDALKMELLYAQGMLNNARGREVNNLALNKLLQKLRQLAYDADDVLDELDYFRIQDELEGTYHAAAEHTGGCLRNHALHARYTAKTIGKILGFSSCSRPAIHRGYDEPSEDTRGVSCGAWPCRGQSTPDGEQAEEEASGGVLCGAAWPCGRASRPQPTQPRLPPINQADQEEAGGGCTGRLASGVNAVGKRLPCHSIPPAHSAANSNMHSSGWRFLSCVCPSKAQQREHVIKAPKLKFDRVEMSKRMKDIAEQLKPVCAKVSTILNLELLDSNRSIAQSIATSLDAISSDKQGRAPLLKHSAAMSRPITTSEFIEPHQFFGRDDETSKIIYDITKGECCDKYLTVLPIVGPGGVGKTTLIQYVYKQLQDHFQERIWVCVSTTFNVYRLKKEIADNLNIKEDGSLEKLIEERLKSKKFLLVLDDMWSCRNDEWRRFLVPFRNGQTKGNIILVTTRFPALAQMVKTTADCSMDLEGLDSKAFKDLFLACIFGDKQSIYDHSELRETGDMIVEKLKRSPLAAKTVGRLLRKHLDLGHWTRVLESKEWESQNDENDIMPALKLSYDYLPFHLQQCFSYSALFPEDYKFMEEELIHLWIGLDILHSNGENKRIEDTGLSHLIELVNYGFYKKEEEEDGYTRYIIHDLLHELALKVSAHECLSIYSSNLRSVQVSHSVRHLSINIDDTSVKDRMTFDACKRDFSTLHERLKVKNLHSLMLFGHHQYSFVKTFGGLFREAKSLRVVFLSQASYYVQNPFVENFLHNFSELVHLRYLRVQSSLSMRLPDIFSRFYHLRVLDLQGCYDLSASTRDMSNLIKLRHFLVPSELMHSEISEVGKLKSLQELTRFTVKRESEGFELRQIGHLVELGGSLCIDNLEKIEVKEEADEAKLMHKKHLHDLILDWDINRSTKDPAREEHVLESFKPHSNLLGLCIRGHGGSSCPSWLGVNLSVKNLESICMDNISWKNLPPLGELWLVNEHDEVYQSYMPGQSFKNLKRLELIKILNLKKWVGNGHCELFPHLKILVIKDCPELMELPFSHRTGCEPEHDTNMTWFSKLEVLRITNCPNLSSPLSIPWSGTICSVNIEGFGLGFQKLDYEKSLKNDRIRLVINGKDDLDLDSDFWMAIAFHNLSDLDSLTVISCPPLSLDHLQMLSSLKSLEINGLSDEKLKKMGIVDQQKKTEAPAQPPSSSTNEAEDARGEEEIAAAAATEGLLLLPPQLRTLHISSCPNLILCRDSLDAGPTGGGEGGGIQPLRSLRELRIWYCPRLLSSYSPSPTSSRFPFPNSLEKLLLMGPMGTSLLPLSNLTSLTSLCIDGCGDLRGEGLGRLLTHGHLTELAVHGTPNFFVGSEPSQLHEQELPPPSSKMQRLCTDDAAGVLAAPIWTLLSSSLTILDFNDYGTVERFTKEQEEALQLLASLEEIGFSECGKLQCLPAGLYRLPNLKRLRIWDCAALRSLPRDDLPPSSLQELQIVRCPAIRSLPKECLPSSLQKLEIESCPTIRSLPKVHNLPSSLQVLNVRDSESEELRRQCRKLIGTIPIVRA